MNRLVLAATVVECGVLRYTPAGLPVLDLILKSESEATENGLLRKISLEIKAVVIGELCRQVQSMALGVSAGWAGFLAPSRNRKGLVFHITEVV